MLPIRGHIAIVSFALLFGIESPCIAQAGLELMMFPASVSQKLGLPVSNHQLLSFLKTYFYFLYYYYFETEFLYGVLDVLELTM